MPTLEEELAALKSELSLLQSRQASDTRQLSERINILQQRIDEQKMRSAEHEQSMLKKFDTLTSALIQQFSAINSHINARFDTLDANLYQHCTAIDARFDQQTADLREKFGSVDHFAGGTWGLVQEQERDIREMKERVAHIDWRLDHVDRRMESGFEAIDKRFGRLEDRVDTLEQGMNARFEQVDQQIGEVRLDMNGRFGSLDEKLNLILERLPKQ